MKPKSLCFRYGSGAFDAGAGLKAVFQWGMVVAVLLGLMAGLKGDKELLVAVGVLGGIVALVVFFVRGAVKGLIVIGRRFVVVNQDIFYYQNLAKVKVEAEKGVITLFKQNFPACVIRQDLFPTGAQHEPKITNNRRQKFDKVKSKLLARMQAAAPELPIQQ